MLAEDKDEHHVYGADYTPWNTPVPGLPHREDREIEMGYARYTITRRGQQIEAGYTVEAECEQPDCAVPTHRGIEQFCGETLGGDEYGCGGYFCDQHLHMPSDETRTGWRCPACDTNTNDLSYTDDDLRTEAARQHRALTQNSAFMQVGADMEMEAVPSTRAAGTPRTWDDVTRLHADDHAKFEKAQHQIHALIDGAADTSAWAVQLGADGLEPEAEHNLTMHGGETPAVRLLLAFHPDVPPATRTEFIKSLAAVMTDAL